MDSNRPMNSPHTPPSTPTSSTSFSPSPPLSPTSPPSALSPTPKEWYVRLENIYVNDSYVGYKRIITNSNNVDDIKQTILTYYSLSPSLKPHLRIWSSPFRYNRLDCLEYIPLQYDFLSIYLQ